ncbi:MAG TPA: DUF4038 domain-containing protein [Candidatus Krumholzibacteria bacterium]|nr:DUF4038 domain-containing protein [Candidatus Krumholzibacteria bacterium]
METYWRVTDEISACRSARFGDPALSANSASAVSHATILPGPFIPRLAPVPLMMFSLIRVPVCMIVLTTAVCSAALRVSPDGRHLATDSGEPFFWLGDTAWELLHRLNEEETAEYLRNRAQKGFTVIQTVVLAELDGLNIPNAAGHLPLIDRDPTRPNPAYFEHVDKVVALAAELGLYVGLLPTWGDKFNRRWGVGPEVFTPEKARGYAAWLAARYRDAPIIWILGGDRAPDNPAHVRVIEAMAEGIRSVVERRQLITYHPSGARSSAEFFHERSWLDFNLFQSGHSRRDNPNFEFTRRDLARKPAKPVIDGEPCYEDHPINRRQVPLPGWFGEFEVRRAGYWSLLAGAAGHTYGHHSVWQMWETARQPLSFARTPWRQALDYPGAFQMGVMRRCFEEYPWTRLRPSQDALGNLPEDPSAGVLAAVDAERQFAFVYSPYGYPFTLARDALVDGPWKARWVDPRTGHTIDSGMHMDGDARMPFDPPGEIARGNDWLLIVTASSFEPAR